MCLSDLGLDVQASGAPSGGQPAVGVEQLQIDGFGKREAQQVEHVGRGARGERLDRKSTRLNSSHSSISYAVFCLKKKKKQRNNREDSCSRVCLLGDVRM